MLERGALSASAGRAPTCHAVVVAVEGVPCSQAAHVECCIAPDSRQLHAVHPWGGNPTSHLPQATLNCRTAVQLPRWEGGDMLSSMVLAYVASCRCLPCSAPWLQVDLSQGC